MGETMNSKIGKELRGVGEDLINQLQTGATGILFIAFLKTMHIYQKHCDRSFTHYLQAEELKAVSSFRK